MKKTRKAHLWIGLICSIFILMESITGLLMNEPWLIGQSQTERGDLQQGMMGPGQQQGITSNNNQATGQTQGTQSQSNGNDDGTTDASSNGQVQSTNGTNTNGQFPGPGGKASFGGDGSTGSFMGIIKGLHEGRIGTTNIKWLIDLTAIAMIFLTVSGIYLSLKVLGADRKRKRARNAREAA